MRSIIKNLSTIHEAIFPKKEKILQESIPKETVNPYVAARHEWNIMFGDIIVAKHNWQRIAFLLSVINIGLVIGMATVSLQKRFIPYAVKVDSLGNANFSGLLTQQNTIQPTMVNAMLRRYIMEARSVIVDPVAEKHQLDFVYRSSMGEASTILDSFYQLRNPFDIVKDETIDVTVNKDIVRLFCPHIREVDLRYVDEYIERRELGEPERDDLINVPLFESDNSVRGLAVGLMKKKQMDCTKTRHFSLFRPLRLDERPAIRPANDAVYRMKK